MEIVTRGADPETVNTDPEGDNPKPRRISELIEGENLFDSRGFSTVKVTKNGVEELIELPIKSTGVDEYMRELEGKAPKPPVKKEVVKKNSKEGRDMGLPHDKMMQVFDTTDDAYIDAIDKHNQDFSWRVAIFALDIDWKKTNGERAATFEEKRAILASNGITWHQVNRIYRDVSDLTQFAEDREDFLSGT